MQPYVSKSRVAFLNLKHFTHCNIFSERYLLLRQNLFGMEGWFRILLSAICLPRSHRFSMQRRGQMWTCKIKMSPLWDIYLLNVHNFIGDLLRHRVHSDSLHHSSALSHGGRDPYHRLSGYPPDPSKLLWTRQTEGLVPEASPRAHRQWGNDIVAISGNFGKKERDKEQKVAGWRLLFA